ncbi:MAG TPA: Type 1 glutamine amidotransferase-like domain-containing protein [Candidatus Eremiobacteraeota bacterium]|nr:Type 1 glutamine amidotransferase-like domain-containing protein [Candidatus Eremiobacteraeota bacterium]
MEKIKYPGLLEHKVEGWCFLNGNVAKEENFVNMCRETILNPKHKNEELNKSKKILLVTAAFEKGHEHHDRHLIEMFEKISIDAKWEGCFPQNIQNLSVYSMFNDFKEKERWLYQKYTEKQDQIKAIKRDYYEKNFHYVEEVYKIGNRLQETYKNLCLYDFYYFYEHKEPEFFTGHLSKEEREKKLADLTGLSKSKLDVLKCEDLRATLDHIIYKDNELFSLCRHIELYYLWKSGVQNNSFYKEQREKLGKRISSSASIFIFGGRVFVLVNRLRFYRLEKFFKEALKEGTNIYGISAGAICQTEKFFLTFERYSPRAHSSASDYGMGLVKGLWIFPHAEDLSYIREANRDKLSLFALRHKPGVAVGLTEKSVLLCEKYREPFDGKIYRRYTSVGEEPVLVFGEKGKRCDLYKYDQIILEGTKFYKGKNQVAGKEDIKKMEEEYLKTLK